MEWDPLNLSDCVLSAKGEVPDFINALSLGTNPRLHTLQLQNNNLESGTLSVLAGAISQGFQNLKTLELQWNDVDVDADSENLGIILLSLKQRDGKLIVSDAVDI